MSADDPSRARSAEGHAWIRGSPRSGGADRSIRWYLVLVALFGAATPFSFWSANAPRGASARGPILLAVLAVAAGTGALLLFGRKSGNGRVATVTAVTLLALFNWRLLGTPVDRLFGLGPDVGALLVVLPLIVLVVRFGRKWEVQISLMVMGLVMVGSSTIGLLTWYATEAPIPESAFVGPTWTGDSGDVFVIIVDGYGRDDVLEELYGFDNLGFVDSLESHGFTVPVAAHANYTSTIASVGSALLGEHVEAPTQRLSDRERVAIHRILGGENPMVDAFKRAGYRYLHIESGWIAGSCGPAVDECLDSTILDEAMWAIADRSVAAGFVEHMYGHSFSENAVRALDDLDDIAARGAEEPRFVLAHIILPHPPLLLSSTCEVDFRRDMTGDAIGHRGYGQELVKRRREAYVDQVECLNDRLLEFIERLDADDTVVIFGDHGPDSFGQLGVDPSQWETEWMWERFAIFAAIRTPSCEGPVPEDWSPLNGLRSLLGCLSGVTVEEVPDRTVIFPIDAAPGRITEVSIGDWERR